MSLLAVRDAVNHVSDGLPSSAQRPELYLGSADAEPVYVVVVGDPAALGTQVSPGFALLLDRDVRSSFEAVDGVGRVEVGGLAVPEVQVTVDAARASVAGLRLSHVATQLREQNWRAGGGTLESPEQRLSLVLITSLPEFEQLLIQLPSGASVRLGDIAEVRLSRPAG